MALYSLTQFISVLILYTVSVSWALSRGARSQQVLVVGMAADPAPAAWRGHCGSQQRGLSEMVKALSPWCTVGPQKPE